ncbi:MULTISPECIES: flavin prenyltransferase UbiX [Paenibacillus]|jgi:4-hydroxy-3-polyprenylbenzoate decarboxylase|uniref:Probable UbiX-like flavin prenyltransferase n=2 Tax=Paenibacillus TaxID=44249 RepID=A0AAJ3IWT7_PAEPO|nr:MULTISPECIES: flavin prenyltransferase UbiX [Paenibacillus]AHC18050.1 phenolic acid decarboxylase [Paenibacillus polymyxa CR1]MCP3746340.1 UbiX family flavin prenyltransferase [Paenibacillus sp. A3M_27_13]MDH2332981.1 UbiX family flavin prenyltransferase [Paenibacillus polymyxa]MDR6780200.1 4-hydroxy-3-polyprenylbenzoate decarboxylase [Paenibacillus peoriae]ODA07234.1 phenolic acid decarboxylase [Paenibacillus polymyxa]
MKKIIVGISGATGSIFGIRILQQLREAGVQSHLVLSPWAIANIPYETGYTVKEVEAMADAVYSYKDQAARISSGSFRVDGMVVAPCSMKTLASIRIGMADNLLTRSADVMLKERKKLLLMTRETPLSSIHLENMLELSRMGVMILPPMPAFYNHPASIEELVDHIVFRALDQFGIVTTAAKRWDGMKQNDSRLHQN